MQKASPRAKAIMWSAGVTSSAVVPTLGALCAWQAGVPGSKLFLIFAVVWAIGTLASNWRSARETMPRRDVLSADRDGDRVEYYCHYFCACHFIYS